MNKFIEVKAYGSKKLLNISHIRCLSTNVGGDPIVYYSDGKWIELQETYEEVKQKILEVTS